MLPKSHKGITSEVSVGKAKRLRTVGTARKPMVEPAVYLSVFGASNRLLLHPGTRTWLVQSGRAELVHRGPKSKLVDVPALLFRQGFVQTEQVPGERPADVFHPSADNRKQRRRRAALERMRDVAATRYVFENRPYPDWSDEDIEDLLADPVDEVQTPNLGHAEVL